jgi:hypothetical protein
MARQLVSECQRAKTKAKGKEQFSRNRGEEERVLVGVVSLDSRLITALFQNPKSKSKIENRSDS